MIILAATEDRGEIRYLEPESGLVLIVPGHPTEIAAPPEPPGSGFKPKGSLALADLPVTLHIQSARTTQPSREVAARLRNYLESRRTSALPLRATVHVADAAQCARYGVVAAASTRYLRSPTVDDPHDAEEVWLLERAPYSIVLRKQFVAQKTSPIGWALLTAALRDSLQFSTQPPPDPGALPAVFAGIDWPRGPFLRPGLGGLTTTAAAQATALRDATRGTGDAARTELARRAATLLSGSEPASTPFSADDRLLLSQFLLDACDSPEQEAILTAALGSVQRTHDVRGLGAIILSALDALTAEESASGEPAFDALSLYVG